VSASRITLQVASSQSTALPNDADPSSSQRQMCGLVMPWSHMPPVTPPSTMPMDIAGSNQITASGSSSKISRPTTS